MYSGFRRGFLRPRGIFTDSHYAKFPPHLESAPGNGTNGTHPRPGTGYEVTAHYLQDMQLASFGECSGKLHKRYTPPGPGPATRSLLTTCRTCSWPHSESAPGNGT